MHVNVRIEPRWTFTEVRRAAVALSRAVERRVPALASSKWWKEERHGVFLDYTRTRKIAPHALLIPFVRFQTHAFPRRFSGAKFRIAMLQTSPCSRFRSGSRKLVTRTR